MFHERCLSCPRISNLLDFGVQIPEHEIKSEADSQTIAKYNDLGFDSLTSITFCLLRKSSDIKYVSRKFCGVEMNIELDLTSMICSWLLSMTSAHGTMSI